MIVIYYEKEDVAKRENTDNGSSESVRVDKHTCVHRYKHILMLLQTRESPREAETEIECSVINSHTNQ